MEVYIGLDVSLASTAICVLGEKGEIVTEAQVASTPESLVSLMRDLPHGIAALGLEAGPLSQWLHKGLSAAGFEAVLMETRQVKSALKAMPIKTDRRDAEGIARLLQMGWFRPVHCKTVSSQEMRALLSSRKSVKDALLDMELSLRGVLRNFGLKLGQVSKGRWEARVREPVAGNAMLEAAAEPILRARTALRRELAGLEKLVRDLASQDPVCRLLMTMPGVGPVVALSFVSAIDDPGRFRRSKDVGPWVGLTPGRNQSGGGKPGARQKGAVATSRPDERGGPRGLRLAAGFRSLDRGRVPRHPPGRPVAAPGLCRRHVAAELQLLHPGVPRRSAPRSGASSGPLREIRAPRTANRPHAFTHTEVSAGAHRHSDRWRRLHAAPAPKPEGGPPGAAPSRVSFEVAAPRTGWSPRPHDSRDGDPSSPGNRPSCASSRSRRRRIRRSRR